MTEGEARRQVARAATRATGERAVRRRRTTPLLAGRDPGEPPRADQSRADEPRTREPRTDQTRTDQTRTREPRADQPRAEATPVQPAGVEPETPAVAPGVEPAAGPRRRQVRVRTGASRRTAGGERLVAVTDADREAAAELVAAASRAGGEADGEAAGAAGDGPGGEAGDGKDGKGGSSIERRLAEVLAFVRRRLTGDVTVDEFGFDPELTDTVLLNLLRPLYRSWFRVEVRGIENIPSTGGALIVANHSGAIAFDALMTQVAVHDEHPDHRHLRLLGADLVFSTPVLGELARKGGATLASNADAERLLSRGELVAVWPEGFKGIGKPFSERYKLQRFGRGGFVSAALKTGTPIVPCAIVGAEETYPIIGNMPSVARLLGIPYAPVTPTWPLLGLLGLVPLPSKWLIEFCPPVLLDDTGPGTSAADDPMAVFDLTDLVRQTIQQTLYSLLVQRRSVFF